MFTHQRQSQRTAANSSTTTSLRTRLRLITAAALAASGIAGALAFTGAGSALASTPVVTETPTFECYSGSILVEKPQIAYGQTITWIPEIDYWANGRWTFATWGSSETVPGNLGGELELYNQSFTAAHHTYFRVVEWFDTATTGWVNYLGQALTGGAPMFSSVCETS
jgi:hypothetical protein